MTTVVVSPKYQIVIPKDIRKQWTVKPGQRLQIVASGERLEVIPLKEIHEMRGFLKGMNTDIDREKERV